MALGVSLILSIGLISSIGHRSEDNSIFEFWIFEISIWLVFWLRLVITVVVAFFLRCNLQ